MAKLRLGEESAEKEAGRGGLRWDDIRETLIDPKNYLTAVRSVHGKSWCVLMGVCRQCSSAPM